MNTTLLDRWSRKLKEFVKSSLFRRVFVTLQRVGVNVTPRHFYSEIPYIHSYEKQDCWKRPYTLEGINAQSVSEQLSFVRECCAPFEKDLQDSSIYEDAVVAQGEKGYGPVESDFLYCFVRRFTPQRVVQIGAGVSTNVIIQAAIDEGYTPSITAVDPYPSNYLRSLSDRDNCELIPEKAQRVWGEINERLSPDDLLFVDSTHTTVPNSDVNRIIIELLPQLKPDIWVHFHDITIPYDYRPSFLRDDLFFWRETLLLMAFLSCNSSYRLVLSQSLLHDMKAEAFASLIPRYEPRRTNAGLDIGPGRRGHYPSSTFIRRSAE